MGGQNTPQSFSDATNYMVKHTLEQNTENPAFIKFWELQMPIINPVKVEVTDSKEHFLELQNYCYPSAFSRDSSDYKGIIFYIHGYQEYISRQVHFAKTFSD